MIGIRFNVLYCILYFFFSLSHSFTHHSISNEMVNWKKNPNAENMCGGKDGHSLFKMKNKNAKRIFMLYCFYSFS